MEYFASPETLPRHAFGAKCHYMTVSMRLLPNIFGQFLGAFAKERKTLLASSFLPRLSVSLSVSMEQREKLPPERILVNYQISDFHSNSSTLQFWLKMGKKYGTLPEDLNTLLTIRETLTALKKTFHYF